VSVRGVLGNNTVILVIGLAVALAAGGFPEAYPGMNRDAAMLCLGVMMTFSLSKVRLRGLRARRHVKSASLAMAGCFAVGGLVTLALSLLFDGGIRDGWVLIAAVPSAISVLPFTSVLRGDEESALVSTVAIYMSSFILTPLITLSVLGSAVEPMTLARYVVLLIALPVVASRPLSLLRIGDEARMAVIHVAFALLIIAVAGPNRSFFLGGSALLVPLILVAALRTFGVGAAVMAACGKRVERGALVPAVLFSTHKNTGMAATMALALIGPEAALPGAASMVVDVVWLIFLSRVVFPTAGDKAS